MAVPPSSQVDCQIVHSSTIVDIANAWRFLLFTGKELATRHDLNPEDIMLSPSFLFLPPRAGLTCMPLVTRAGTNQDFYIRDFRTPPLGIQDRQHHHAFSPNRGGLLNQPTQFGHTPAFPMQHGLPEIMYMLTSPDQDYNPYWTHEPVSVPPSVPRPSLKRGWTYKIGLCVTDIRFLDLIGLTENSRTGFVNWIQLYAEDFVE